MGIAGGDIRFDGAYGSSHDVLYSTSLCGVTFFRAVFIEACLGWELNLLLDPQVCTTSLYPRANSVQLPSKV